MEVQNGNKKVQIKIDPILKELGESMVRCVEVAMNKALAEIQRPQKYFITSQSGNRVINTLDLAHEKFSQVLMAISANVPVFLVGEAGSGKTTMCEDAAEMLGRRFFCTSVCAQTNASTLLGYMDANGRYVRSLFREAFENGGVFLLDEIDNGNANVLSVLNSAMANSTCAFPDGMIQKHKDFLLLASGNTYGHGPNRKYVGRLEIDGATLDRFVTIEITYDEKLEKRISQFPKWAELVQKIRYYAQDMQLRCIISPRASIYGSRLLYSGFDVETVLRMVVFKDIETSQKNDILDHSSVRDLISQVKNEVEELKKREESLPPSSKTPEEQS